MKKHLGTISTIFVVFGTIWLVYDVLVNHKDVTECMGLLLFFAGLLLSGVASRKSSEKQK
ncbi:MAG: hypothetical protein AAF960_09110 [Bacteroidota bacterium]